MCQKVWGVLLVVKARVLVSAQDGATHAEAAFLNGESAISLRNRSGAHTEPAGISIHLWSLVRFSHTQQGQSASAGSASARE